MMTAEKARGVEQRGNIFQAKIRIHGKLTYLGSFKTLKEASDTYEAAALKHPRWEGGGTPGRKPSGLPRKPHDRTKERRAPGKLTAPLRAAHFPRPSVERLALIKRLCGWVE